MCLKSAATGADGDDSCDEARRLRGLRVRPLLERTTSLHHHRHRHSTASAATTISGAGSAPPDRVQIRDPALNFRTCGRGSHSN